MTRLKHVKLFENFGNNDTPGGEIIGGVRQPINPDAIVWSKEIHDYEPATISGSGLGDFASVNPETNELRWQHEGYPVAPGFKRIELEDVDFEKLYSWPEADAIYIFNTPPLHIEGEDIESEDIEGDEESVY